ncbi:TlpA family protein disulfide reductase [Formosa sp. S-31]|uniref:TlpA family protein disulfide reductase n=1 Tax=Formosa sp. S-31 TaxID=2790949 RepID=UPI003EBE76AE
MRFIVVLFSCLFLLNCKEKTQPKLALGVWRATLETKGNDVLPFNFKVESDSTLVVFNAEEKIFVNEITYKNDSIVIKLPVFDSYIKAKMYGDSLLEGAYIKDELKRTVPFKAVFNDVFRFEAKDKPLVDVSGNWETTFSPDSEDSSQAKGIFVQQGQRVTGTFRTTTGDYRFLEGVMDGDSLKLSAFDGSHAFLFTAQVEDSTLSGMFYSGNHYKEPFIAKRNDAFQLADADSLTFLKPGYDAISFSFPDETGKLVSLSDPQFKDKVVVVQLMGTWCPNCLDETKYFKSYLDNYPSNDVAFVGLAFEYAKTEEQAFKNIDRLKKRLDIQYPVLLAQTGSTSKQSAQEKLPMLNTVLSYPTAIFIDKKGKVRKIHTGFNGPATGDLYENYKEEFEQFMAMLLSE